MFIKIEKDNNTKDVKCEVVRESPMEVVGETDEINMLLEAIGIHIAKKYKDEEAAKNTINNYAKQIIEYTKKHFEDTESKRTVFKVINGNSRLFNCRDGSVK